MLYALRRMCMMCVVILTALPSSVGMYSRTGDVFAPAMYDVVCIYTYCLIFQRLYVGVVLFVGVVLYVSVKLVPIHTQEGI